MWGKKEVGKEVEMEWVSDWVKDREFVVLVLKTAESLSAAAWLRWHRSISGILCIKPTRRQKENMLLISVHSTTGPILETIKFCSFVEMERELCLTSLLPWAALDAKSNQFTYTGELALLRSPCGKYSLLLSFYTNVKKKRVQCKNFSWPSAICAIFEDFEMPKGSSSCKICRKASVLRLLNSTCNFSGTFKTKKNLIIKSLWLHSLQTPLNWENRLDGKWNSFHWYFSWASSKFTTPRSTDIQSWWRSCLIGEHDAVCCKVTMMNEPTLKVRPEVAGLCSLTLNETRRKLTTSNWWMMCKLDL